MQPLLANRATQAIMALAMMSLVAIVGAILNWSWWLCYAAITPSAIWLIVAGRLVVYRELTPGSSDRRVPVLLVLPVLLAVAIRPTRYSGLVVVLAFVVVCIFSKRANPATPVTRTKRG
jgi:uncharacterized membrane protein